ncbi:armadillo-type protein [Gongronella butleri]|nr:armadillo-type protein [Gongronella butleri]
MNSTEQQADAAQIAAQFMEACADFQVPATRTAAEETLKSFRQIPKVLPIAKYILDHATEPTVQFQVSLAIGIVAVRDYTLYALEDLLQLKNYLIEYSIHHEKMPKYVRDYLLSAAALITKRSLSDISEQDRRAVLANVTQLLTSSAPAAQLTGAALCNALVDQFSSTRASTVGLNWEFHHNARLFFEVEMLQPMFQETITQMHAQLNQMPASPTIAASPVLTELLTLAEKILTWDFETVKNQPSLPGSFASDVAPDDIDTADQGGPSAQRASYSVFPPTWRAILSNHDVLWLFFAVYERVQDHNVLGHRALQSLVRLAGLREDFFANDQTAIHGYARTMMHGLVQMIHGLAQRGTSPEQLTEQGPQMLGTIQMVRMLMENISVANFCATSEFFPFLQELQHLTLCCLQATAHEMDEGWISEASDECLQTWVVLADIVQPVDPRDQSGRKGLSEAHLAQLNEVMKSVAYRVVETYMQTQLERARQVLAEEDEEEDEIDSGLKDWDTYEDQLQCIAALGRLHPAQCIAHLSQLLADRMQRFHAFLNGTATDQGELLLIHEQMHWIALMAGFLLADAGFGEQPFIPDPILQLSTSMAPENDQVVHLANQFLELLRVYASFGPHSIEAANYSPRVAETLAWYMERWTKSYLLMDENEYGQMSAGLAHAFGKPGPSDGQGTAVLDFLLQQIKANFMLWNAEQDVLTQLIYWLDTLGTGINTKNSLVHSHSFPDLIKFLTANVGQLPESVHNYLIKTITDIASSVSDDALRHEYLDMIFSMTEERLSAVLHHADFATQYQAGNVMDQVLNALDMFDGIALAMETTNTAPVFAFLSRFFESFHKLFEIYKDVSEVQLLILQLLSDIMSRVDLTQISAEQKQGLYQFTTEIIRLYGRFHTGKKRLHSQEEEADRPYEDIATILMMLTNLMNADNEGSRDANAADVALFGIHTVLPMIDLEMLQLPSLCTQYISLVSKLITRFPDKLPELPASLMDSLMSSLEYGLRHPITEINLLTLHAVVPLATWMLQHQGNLDMLRARMDALLGVLLQMLLFQQLEPSIVYMASDALLGLLLVAPATYLKMVQQIIAQQAADLQPRLIHAFEKLDAATPKQNTPPTKEQSNAFRTSLSALLMDARAVLRVK